MTAQFSGAVTVISGDNVVVAPARTSVHARPETELEKTQPMPPLTTTRLVLQAIRIWLAFLRRGDATVKLLLAGILIALVAILLRQPGAAVSAAGPVEAPAPSATTFTPAPPMSQRIPVVAQEDPAAVAPQAVGGRALAALPAAVVGAVVPEVLRDPSPGAEPGAVVLHPTDAVAVYAEPGGPPVAKLPPWQLLSPTWVPVIDRRPGWALALLPAQPHSGGAAAAGWIYLNPTVQLADAGMRIELNATTGAVTVLAELGRAEPENSVLGRPVSGHPTAGRSGARSFVAIGASTDGVPWFLRPLLPIAVNATRLCSGFLGGVSVPGLPATSVLGALDGAGCVPVPPALCQALADVPAGTTVVMR
ncbi:hypothetical protein ACIRG5_47135 [Lentzea sp. NPDC102401]|uniref:hypothetical protein n=1 Tax=Lentzea sp. NPDC102401 TaxID=3364128 RepID=UPI003819D610